MPKKNRKDSNINAKGRSHHNPEQYLKLPHRIIKSPQFRSLNGNEVRVLLEICSRCNGFNNGRIGAGQEDLAKILMMSKSTSKKALDNLERTKFLVCQKRGYFTRRIASEWTVTFLGSGGCPPSNDWGQAKTLKHKRKISPKPFFEEMLADIEQMRQEEN